MTEEIAEIEKWPFCNHHNNNDSCKNHQWMLKPSHEVSWGTGYVHSLKIYLNKLLMNYKGKKGTFTVEKSGGHQVIKVNITNNGINWHHVPPDVMHWGHNITYVLFLPKMHNLKLVMRKQSDKPKTEGQTTKQLTYTLQKRQCVERQRKAEELSVWSWIGSWIRK